LIWATGQTDTLNYHGQENRGQKLTTLLGPFCSDPCAEPAEREAVLNENYLVRWETNDEAQRAQFHVIVATTGYVGFGISDEGKMMGADIIIGGVGANGETYFGVRPI
jgi:DOMON domain